MSHSHSHSHSHSGRSGHSGHSHATSPYSRTCQSPTTTSCYIFLLAFLSALTSISLPTHITGYFLPSLKQTILLWVIVAIGLIYSAICTSLFFKVLEIAISEDYRVKRSDEGEMEKSSKLSILKGLSWVGMVMLMSLLGVSIGLFWFHLRTPTQEWLEFCTSQSILFPSSEHSIEFICASMALNQTYLILLVPAIMVPIEGMRHVETLKFVRLAEEDGMEGRSTEKAPRIELEGLREERELGRTTRRRERREKEMEESGSESGESRERLINV